MFLGCKVLGSGDERTGLMKGPTKNGTGQVSFGTMAFAKMNKTIFNLHPDHLGSGYRTDFDYHDFFCGVIRKKFLVIKIYIFLHSI